MNKQKYPNIFNHFFSYTAEMTEIAMPLQQAFAISYFSFKRTFKDGRKIYLFNDAKIYEHYFKRQCFLYGNREGAYDLYTSSYDLWDYLPDPQNIYAEFENLFSLTHGLTITRRSENHTDFFYFGTTPKNRQVKAAYLHQREIFDRFCDYFLEKGKLLLSTVQPVQLDFPSQEVQLIFEPNLCLTDLLSQFKLQKNIPNFTARELDCIQYLKNGCSNKAIAQALGISCRTVEEYVQRLRHKLGCRSKAELIARLSSG